MSDFLPIIRSNDEERVHNRIMIGEPVDELRPLILLSFLLGSGFERLSKALCLLSNRCGLCMRADGLYGDGTL